MPGSFIGKVKFSITFQVILEEAGRKFYFYRKCKTMEILVRKLSCIYRLENGAGLWVSDRNQKIWEDKRICDVKNCKLFLVQLNMLKCTYPRILW
jgi:hypothetical protein